MLPFAQQSNVTVFAGRPAVLWPHIRAFTATTSTVVVKIADGISGPSETQPAPPETFQVAQIAMTDDLDQLPINPADTIVVSHAETYNDGHFNFCVKLANEFQNQTYVLLVLPEHVDWRDDAFPRPEDVDPTWRQFATNCVLLYRQTDYYADGDPTIIERPLRHYTL